MTAKQPEQLDGTRLRRGRARRFAGSVAAAALGRAVTPLLSLAITPYALSKLGAERFGLFALALAVCGWLALVDVGLSAGLRVVLARQSGDLETAKLRPLLGATAAGQAALAALGLAAGAGLARWAPALLDVPEPLRAEAGALLWLIALGAAATTLARPFSAALEACQWMSADRMIRLGQNVLRLALLALLLAAGWGLGAAGWSYLAAACAGAAATVWTCRRLLPELSWRPGSATREAFEQLLAPGLWLSLGAAGGVLIAGLDRAVAARAVSLEAVTMFALSGAAYLLAESVWTCAVDAARPALAQALGQGERAEARAIYGKLCRGIAAAAPLSALALLAANRAFVGAWAGPEVYGGLALDLWLAAALLVNLWSLPHRAFLSASLQIRPQTLWRLAEGGLNLVLSVGLALRFGIAGVAAGTALAGACTSLWALPRLAARAGGEPAWRAWAGFAPSLAACAAAAPLAWWARETAGTAGLASAALAGGAVFVTGAALWWRWGLSPQTRLHWRALARGRRAAWPAAV